MTDGASLDTIEDFLAQKRIAIVGLSRDDKHFSGMLFEELSGRGYDMVPVNPHTTEIRGRRCFARLQDVQPPPDAVLLMTSPAVSEMVVRDCAEAGIRRVWMYRAGGDGAVSAEAIKFCRANRIEVVPGECPFMFLPRAGIHRIHGFVRKIMGSYPRRRLLPASLE
jgi:predicted CoA-binding protein